MMEALCKIIKQKRGEKIFLNDIGRNKKPTSCLMLVGF